MFTILVILDEPDGPFCYSRNFTQEPTGSRESLRAFVEAMVRGIECDPLDISAIFFIRGDIREII